jgi:diguanylate cyclase (GGDEF)-like protein
MTDSTATPVTLATPLPLEPGRAAAWHALKLGIGARLLLGLAAVTVVVLAGHAISTRATVAAAESVRRMQTLHETLAQRANLVLERLNAFDRSVGAALAARPPRTPSADELLPQSGQALTQAVDGYFNGAPAQADSTAGINLRAQLKEHVAHGMDLAGSAGLRTQWVEERRALLDRAYQRVSAAGGTGLAINGTQVIARRSLAELASALGTIRSDPDAPAATAARREQDFRTLLASHESELQRSPGLVWLSLLREDFDRAGKARLAIERFNVEQGPRKRAFLDESAALTSGVEQELQAPARRGLLTAAEEAARSAELAERTLTLTGASVLGVVLLVSGLLAFSIIRPVQRLTRATRLLADGDRHARAPRGGSAEIDQLAESFNTMADQVARAEAELRSHQAQLERRVEERTHQLHHLAHHDPLTQLPNRLLLGARLGAALERAHAAGKRVGLLFVDIDNFKSINDTLGHSYGDLVLKQIAQRLQSATRQSELLARLGGDEFTVLIEDLESIEALQQRAAELVAALQPPLTVEGRVLGTSASVGAGVYPDHAENAEGLLRAADVALFRAKERGRERHALFTPELYRAAEQRFRLEQSLRRGIEAGDLLLMYQPQVALQTCEVVGVEALMRWRKPEGHLATASEFIHIAEQTGLVHDLTDWVLRCAAATAAGWRERGWQNVSMAVNVSAPQFLESDFVEQIERVLEATGLPPQLLELELTETVLQTGQSTIDSLHRLRGLGIAVALDDFGIGYSSLTSLQQLPITRVKLDRMLIEGVDENPRSAAIVRSIVALCHGLGLQVIAEGVERPAQLEFLSGCGPIGVQGFLLARPVPAADMQLEAQAASARARSLLCAKEPQADPGGNSLVFVSKGARKRS